MREWERRIRQYREHEERLPEVKEAQIARAAARARRAFYAAERAQPNGYLSFLLLQARFVRRRWWAAQFAVLSALWLGLYTVQDEDFLQRGSSVLIPAFVILMVPELWKNARAQSAEIESASYFTLRQVYAARLTLFAAVDLLLLSLFLGVTMATVSLTLWDALIQFAIPFQVTCCICLRTLCCRRYSEYHCIILSLIWSSVWMWIVMNETIYAMISTPIWLALLTGSAAYLAYAVWKLLQSANNSWEEDYLWN